MVDLPSLRCDWSTTFAPNYQPIRFRTKINCDLVTRVFPRVVIYFCFYRSLRFQWLDFATLCDWSKIFTPNSQPIRCKSKINRDLVTRVFPHVVIYLCFYRSVRFHWFNFVRFVIGRKYLLKILNQSDAKLKSVVTWSSAFPARCN